MKSPIYVLGIGSPFSDDQLGWRVIDLLMRREEIRNYLEGGQLYIEKCDRPNTRLLESMQGASLVFLIDAVKSGADAGFIHRLQDQEIETINSAISSHAIGIGEVLSLGRTLGLLPEKIVFYGIEIGKTDSQLSLSPSIIPGLQVLLEKLLDELLSINLH